MSATCTQHDLHAVRCGCGRAHVAALPDGGGGHACVLRAQPAGMVRLPDGGVRDPGPL